MKVFVPMPDDEATLRAADELVPFRPEYLLPVGEDRKPRNWISDNDYTAAIRRLHQRDLLPA